MVANTLFGTSGIRGDAEKIFTKQFCYDIGKTFVEFLKRNNLLAPIAIGIDPRTSSPRIKKDLIAGLSQGGVEIFDEGITPIPSVNWLIKTTSVKSAVMVTGSHIAPELNGVKFYAHDEEISEEDERQIENIYFSLKEKEEFKQALEPSVLEDRARQLYSEMLFGIVKKELPKWKVTVDCANGSQSVVIPALLERLGFEVVKVNCDPQADFIARDTDTDDKAQIEEIKETVVKESCDFGIAYDGDGDRVVFIDEKGNFIQGEYSCSLIAKNSAGENIVTAISASQVVDKIGKKVYRTKVGSPFIIGKMKEVGATFGFEPNGGAVSGEVMYTRDGGTTTVKMLNLLSKSSRTLSQLVATLPKFYMFRTKVEYKWELKDTIINAAREKFKGIKIEELDGLKIWINENSWILFRSSANAPEFRVFAESASAETAKKLLADGLTLVNEIISKSK